VLGLALLWALNPALLGIILLVISRQRPVQNLLVCWVGCMITNVPALLIPLLALHGTPMFRSYANSLATPDTGAGHTGENQSGTATDTRLADGSPSARTGGDLHRRRVLSAGQGPRPVLS
jgi:hypothetical protein